MIKFKDFFNKPKKIEPHQLVDKTLTSFDLLNPITNILKSSGYVVHEGGQRNSKFPWGIKVYLKDNNNFSLGVHHRFSANDNVIVSFYSKSGSYVYTFPFNGKKFSEEDPEINSVMKLVFRYMVYVKMFVNTPEQKEKFKLYFYDNILKNYMNGDLDKKQVQEEIIKNNPGDMKFIKELDPEVKKNNSHLEMGNKFGVFDDEEV